MLQAFADVATIVIVQAGQLSVQQLTARIDAALGGRTVVERAKGILAYSKDVDLATAYRLLQARARSDQVTLTEAAEHVVREAATRR